MDILQTWLIIGVPGLLLAASLLVGHDAVRAWGGVLTLFVMVVAFATIPGDVISAAIIGLLAMGAIGAGVGQPADEMPEHHENRRRFTVADQGE